MLPLICNLFWRDHKSYADNDEMNPGMVDFPCEVIGCVGHLQFTVRSDSGRSYKVQAAQYLAHLMNHRSRVHISGSLIDGVVWARSIIPLGNNGQHH